MSGAIFDVTGSYPPPSSTGSSGTCSISRSRSGCSASPGGCRDRLAGATGEGAAASGRGSDQPCPSPIPSSTTTRRSRSAATDLARRRAPRGLGRAERGVLRAPAARERGPRAVAPGPARRVGLLLPRLRQPRRLLADVDVLERHGIRGSVALNVALCEHHPEIIEACRAAGWEFFSHGVYNTRYLFGMDEARGAGGDRGRDRDRPPPHGPAPRRVALAGPSNTERTIGLLAEYGVRYVCDLFHDDQPFPVNVPRRPADQPPVRARDQRRHRPTGGASPRRASTATSSGPSSTSSTLEGAESGRVMCIPLHPFQSGRPHRVDALDRALAHITAHAGVWLATGAEIADWYYASHYEARRRPPRRAAARRAARRVPIVTLTVRPPRVSPPRPRDGPRPIRVVALARAAAGVVAGRQARGAGRHADAPVVPARHDRDAVPAGRDAGRALPRLPHLQPPRLREPRRHLPDHGRRWTAWGCRRPAA